MACPLLDQYRRFNNTEQEITSKLCSIRRDHLLLYFYSDVTDLVLTYHSVDWIIVSTNYQEYACGAILVVAFPLLQLAPHFIIMKVIHDYDCQVEGIFLDKETHNYMIGHWSIPLYCLLNSKQQDIFRCNNRDLGHRHPSFQLPCGRLFLIKESEMEYSLSEWEPTLGWRVQTHLGKSKGFLYSARNTLC